MRLTFVGLMLFASTALGQTVAFTGTNIQDGKEIVVSRANCANPRSFTWTRTGALCDTLYIFISTDNACNRVPGTNDLSIDDFSASDSTATGTLNFRVSDVLALLDGDQAASCETLDIERTFKLCASTARANSTGTGCESNQSSVGTAITVKYDSKAPAAPAAPTVTGLDKSLSVTVTAPSDAENMQVEVRSLATDADGGVSTGDVVATSDVQSTDNLTFRVGGLENGVEYAVVAFAIDAAENKSLPSAPTNGTPVASRGFFDAYVGAGGKETGGCGAAGGGIAGSAVLAVLGFWLSRRKQS